MPENGSTAYTYSKILQKTESIHRNCVEPVEEYEPVVFHSVQIGNTFDSGRYLIVHKLGFGGFSKVWFALDSWRKIYVALKFIAAKHSKTERDYYRGLNELFRALALGGAAGCNEIKMINYIAQGVDVEGRKRLIVDIERFWVRGPNRKHVVLVFEVNGPCFQDYIKKWYNAMKARGIALQTTDAMRCLLRAGVGYGDFTTRNILLKLQISTS